MNYTREYIDKIQRGEIIVSKRVAKWYVEHILPIIDGKSDKYTFKEAKGEKFIKFVEGFCKQSKGKWAGKPFELLLFQKAKWQAIFGIVHKDTGLRRFQEIFDLRGRKNGKTSEHACLGLYLTMVEKGAEIYVSATTRAQALRTWEESQSILDQSTTLSKCMKYKVFPQPTIYTTKGYSAIPSNYKVLSKNVKTFDGLNASGALIDEIHELPRSIYDILKQSMTAREEPLLSMISTAGFQRKQLFDDEYDYACNVIDNLVNDDTLFPLLYELDDPNEVADEECWIKANPGIDVIKDRDKLRQNVIRMQSDANFGLSVKIKDFNIIGVQRQVWLTAQEINNGEWGLYSKEEVGEWGTPKWWDFVKKFNNQITLLGYDLSMSLDMSSVSVLLFDGARDSIILLPMFFITESFLESEDCITSKVPFRQWVDRGLIRIAGRERVNYNAIVSYISEELPSQFGYVYQFIAYDPWNSSMVVDALDLRGYSEKYVQSAVRQGRQTLSEPCKEFLVRMREKRITYLGNPVMKWQLSNVEMEPDINGNIMPKKVNDKREKKIDGFMASLNALVKFLDEPSSYMNQYPLGKPESEK